MAACVYILPMVIRIVLCVSVLLASCWGQLGCRLRAKRKELAALLHAGWKAALPSSR